MTVEDDRNRRILVIDDNQAIHQDFRKILVRDDDSADLNDAATALFGGCVESHLRSQLGYEIDSAYQGQAGLDKVVEASRSGRPYALAFVDMRMPPDWDGVETIERLWQEDPDLQVVICTAYSDYSWAQIVDRLGRSDQLLILKKPFDVAEVAQLASALSDRWHLAKRSRWRMDELISMVEHRTAELRKEVDERRRAEEELRERTSNSAG